MKCFPHFATSLCLTDDFRRNQTYNGRTFFKLIYVDIMKDTCIRSWKVRGKWSDKHAVFLRFHVLYLFYKIWCHYTAQVRPWAHGQVKSSQVKPSQTKPSQAEPYGGECAMCSTWSTRDDFYATLRVFLVESISLCHLDVNYMFRTLKYYRICKCLLVLISILLSINVKLF